MLGSVAAVAGCANAVQPGADGSPVAAASSIAAASSSAPASGCDSPTILDLSAARAESTQAPGTPAPLIANYGGTYGTSDSRNFVAQISGTQAIAAKLNLGPDVKAADRIVVVVAHGSFSREEEGFVGIPGQDNSAKRFTVAISMQDLTTGDPALSEITIDGCTK